MKKYWLFAIPFVIFSCGGGEEETENTDSETSEGTDSTEVVGVEIDSTILPSAFEGEADAEFEMNWMGELYTFQLTAEFNDAEGLPQSVLTLYTGSVERALLPVHPSSQGFVSAKNEQDLPITIDDFNGDEREDIMITLNAFMLPPPYPTEGTVAVPSIYFQREDGTFQNSPVVDVDLTSEMSIDEKKGLCAAFDTETEF